MGRWSKKKQKFTAKNEAYYLLLSMFEKGRGRSKFIDKQNGETLDKIYSSATFETYKKQSKRFLEWVKQNYSSLNLKRLKDFRPYVNDYLKHLIDKGQSPWSIKTTSAALAKLYQTDTSAFIETPRRFRNMASRSRNSAIRDKNISLEKELFFSKITSSTGLRRSELKKVRGSDLVFLEGEYYINVNKGTKGGRPRLALIKGSNESETLEIVNLFKQQGNLLLVNNVPSNYDNHHYRSIYAKRIYNLYSRPLNEIPDSEKYFMRFDRKGEVLDRDAMFITSKFLGHSRISVIAQSYLY